MPTLLIREASGEEDMRHVRALCRDYRALLADRTADRPDILKTYYDSESYEALLQRLPQMHTAPDGAIFLAFLDAQPVACGMHHRIGPETCEIKRVFASEAARGHGAGRGIIEAVMERARTDGYREIKLDTMIRLTEAIGLYRKLGFEPCAPFYDLDPAFEGLVEFYGRPL